MTRPQHTAAPSVPDELSTTRSALEQRALNLDLLPWNENWLRILQQAMDEGAIPAGEQEPALQDAQIQLTQQARTPRPITSIELFRGAVYEEAETPFELESIDVHLHDPWPTLTVSTSPLSAWTLSLEVAYLFAGGFAVPGAGPCRGFLLRTVVPVERIFATALTGMGNAALAEHVIIGGPLEAAITEIPR